MYYPNASPLSENVLLANMANHLFTKFPHWPTQTTFPDLENEMLKC